MRSDKRTRNKSGRLDEGLGMGVRARMEDQTARSLIVASVNRG